METPITAWFDNPSILDWKYKDVIPTEAWGFADKVALADLLSSLIAFSQHKDPRTKRGCGWYGMIQNLNAQKILEDSTRWKNNQEDPKEKWIEWNEWTRPTPDKWTGTGIQKNLNIFKNNKRITWHARCDGIGESKRALDNGDLIYTGSDNGDWQNVYKTWVYKVRKDNAFVWHIFCVIWYDDEWFIGCESNWPKYWKFIIPYDLRGTLYSKNAVFWNKHSDLILKYRTMNQFENEKQLAIEKGFTNGEDAKAPTPRDQASVMALRAYTKAKQEAKDEILEEMYRYIDSKFETLLKAIAK